MRIVAKELVNLWGWIIILSVFLTISIVFAFANNHEIKMANAEIVLLQIEKNNLWSAFVKRDQLELKQKWQIEALEEEIKRKQ